MGGESFEWELDSEEVIEKGCPEKEDVKASLSVEIKLLEQLEGGRLGRGMRRSVTEKRDVLRKKQEELLLLLAELQEEVRFAEKNRPRTRADCVGGYRPCPWVGCRHHLYLDVNDVGNIRFNFPNLGVDELPVSCALDVADTGPLDGDNVGVLLNITRESVRNMLDRALDKILDSPFSKELRKLFYGEQLFS